MYSNLMYTVHIFMHKKNLYCLFMNMYGYYTRTMENLYRLCIMYEVFDVRVHVRVQDKEITYYFEFVIRRVPIVDALRVCYLPLA